MYLKVHMDQLADNEIDLIIHPLKIPVNYLPLK